jgi:hypothetical protein
VSGAAARRGCGAESGGRPRRRRGGGGEGHGRRTWAGGGRGRPGSIRRMATRERAGGCGRRESGGLQRDEVGTPGK